MRAIGHAQMSQEVLVFKPSKCGGMGSLIPCCMYSLQQGKQGVEVNVVSVQKSTAELLHLVVQAFST